MNKTIKMLFFSMMCSFGLQASNCNEDYGLGSVYVVPVQENKILFSQPAGSNELQLPSVAICEGETFNAMAARALWRSGLQSVAVYGARAHENDLFYVAEIKSLSSSWFGFVKEQLPQNIISLSKEELYGDDKNILKVKKALILAIYDAYQADKKAGTLQACDVNSRLY